MNSSSVNRFVSTLNVVLLFAGYEFFSAIVSIFVGNTESPMVNIGYRGLSTIVCLFVIFTNLGKRHHNSNQTIVLLLYIFWFLLIMRFVDDMYLRPEVSILPSIRTRTWLYMVILTIMPMISVSLSIEQIDFNRAFKWITILFFVSVIIAFFQNFNYDVEEIDEISTRVSSGGFSSIGSGHFALTAILLSACHLLRGGKRHAVLTIVLFGIIIVSTIVMLRTGSRGPLLAFFGVGAVFAISKTKRPLIWLLVLVVFALFYNQIFDLLLNAIRLVAPNLYSRFMFKAENGGQFESRMFHYLSAIEAFRDNPIIGKQFAIYLSGGEMVYAHNLFLDAIMQLGIIGGTMILVIVVGTMRLVYRLIRQGSCMLWICLIFVQKFFYLMLSSSFYYTPLFSIIIVLLFKWDSLEKRRSRSLNS